MGESVFKKVFDNGQTCLPRDGETAVARIDISTGETTASEYVATELREITCIHKVCILSKRRLPQGDESPVPFTDCPGFGVYQLDTSSFYSIVNVNSSLN